MGASFLENQPHTAVSAGIVSDIFRRIASLFFVVPAGIFLGGVAVLTLGELPRTGGWLSETGAAAAAVALFAAAGAGAAAAGKGRRSAPDLMFPVLILLTVYAAWPEPRVALAVGGVLFGGVLALLPPRGALLRLGFGAAFALTALLLAFGVFHGTWFLLILFPVVFALAVFCCRTHWTVKLVLCLMLPVAVYIFAFGVSRGPDGENPRMKPVAIAPALPASLLPEGGEERTILFVSGRPSPLPGVWCSLPYVKRVDGIWPNAASLAGGNWFKLNYYSGLPGRILPKLAGNYDLIYLEELPPGSPAARKHFTREAWRKLNPATGVLILPAAARGDLPPGAVRVLPVPGSRGELLAASPDAALTADPEKLDRRMEKLLGGFGRDAAFMPPGIFAALYTEEASAAPVLREALREEKQTPGFFLPAAAAAVVAYLLLRLWFARFGRAGSGFALAENGAGFAMLLLAAGAALAERELTTGVPAAAVWAMPGLAVFHSILRPRVERGFVAVSLLLPFLWLWNSWALPSEPAWLAVLLAAARAAGIVRCRVTAEAGFTGSVSTILGASGFAAGAAVYWAFSVWLPEPLTAALLTALLLRAIWVVRA